MDHPQPSPDGHLIERTRLLDLMSEAGPRLLTVVHAPAGYGKTTVAVQWLARREAGGARVAWLAMHRDDNDPRWFLAHLLRALTPVLAGDEDVLRDLGALLEESAEDVRDHTLSVVLERIAGCGAPVVIACDDWHLVEEPAVRSALSFLLEHAPPTLSVLVTSRTRPELRWATLRLRGQLLEIDSDELRFDLTETREFLLALHGLRLTGEEVARLSEDTDGWVAALQLVSLSLRGTDDPAGLVRGFSGRHRSIGEYFAEDVLDALPARVLDFLLATCVVDRLCGGLADALAGGIDGQAMLEELERQDLFLRPLDVERAWFGYHHLFADHLRRRLRRDRPGEEAGLHARACTWFAEHGLVSEAVTHALAAGDPVRATDVVEAHAMPLVEHGRTAALLGLLARLPATAVDDRPELLMALAWAHCVRQRPHAAQEGLDRLRRALDAAGAGADEDTRCEADVVQACIDLHGDRIDRAEALVRRSLEHPGAHRPWVVAVAANIQTFCDVQAMRYRGARARQHWARPFQDRATGPCAGVYGRCFAGIAAFAELDVVAAREHLLDAVRLARESAGRWSHAARLAGALLGELHHARGELDEAERLLEESSELGAEGGVVDSMVPRYALLGRLRAERGDPSGAALLDEGDRVAQRLGLPRLRAAVGAERVRRLLAAGELDAARWVVDELPAGGDGRIGVAVDRLRAGARAAVLSAAGEHDRAAALLEGEAATASAHGCVRAEVVVTAQLVGVLERAGRQLAAERALAGVVGRLAAAGLPRLLDDGGPEARAVLARLAVRARGGTVSVAGIRLCSAEALEHLLTSAPTPPATPPTPAAGVAAAGLTGRETEVLGMLDVGRTNIEIARALDVTVNTVKWYLKNINTKLGASNRTEAVSLARRLGVLGRPREPAGRARGSRGAVVRHHRGEGAVPARAARS